MSFEPPDGPGRVVSPLRDWSDDSLGDVIDIADCFDFKEGVELAFAVVAEVVVRFDEEEKWEVLLDLLDALDEKEEGGVLRKFCLRNVNPGARPLACFSVDSRVSEAEAAVLEAPEAVREVCRADGVDFLNTASLYRSTTPRANRLFPLAPFFSS